MLEAKRCMQNVVLLIKKPEHNYRQRKSTDPLSKIFQSNLQNKLQVHSSDSLASQN